MTLTVISPPGEAALSLDSAKAFLKIGHEGEDGLVTELIAAATARLEQASGLALVSRQMCQSWRRLPDRLREQGGVILRPEPVQSLDRVQLIDADGESSDVTDRFEVDDCCLHLRVGAWLPSIPHGGRLEIEFTAGFGDASDIPEDLVQALKSLLAVAYRRDGASEDGLAEAKAIVTSRRTVRI